VDKKGACDQDGWVRGSEGAVPPGRYDRYWDLSTSGVHQISRPIVIDGLQRPRVVIDLAPRVRWAENELIDDSYNAVEHTAEQLYANFNLPQLAMATVALRVHMRMSKEHLQKKKNLQERWTELARRMKRARVEDERLRFDEDRLADKRVAPTAGMEGLEELFALEAEELVTRRQASEQQKAEMRRIWTELEGEDDALMKNAPTFEQSQDLQDPYRLTLVANQGAGPRPRQRSLASAMHTFVEALQKPLSRTDQMLLEIALRRCMRALAPDEEERRLDQWEKRHILDAEEKYALEFPHLTAYVRSSGGG